MIRSRRRNRREEEAEIIIVPMIDTMMFLLVCFIVASLAMAVQLGLPVNLPKASTSQPHQAENLTLTITRSNQFYLNTTPVTLATETAALRRAHAGPKSLLILNADQMVYHGTVVAAMNEARKAGIVEFAIATAK